MISLLVIIFKALQALVNWIKFGEPERVAAVATFCAVLIALIIGIAGIFRDKVRSILIKPELEIDFKLKPPYCHMVSFRDRNTKRKICDSHSFRFMIKNSGNFQMEDAEVLAVELKEKKANNKYEKVEEFLPLNLEWAVLRFSEIRTDEGIS